MSQFLSILSQIVGWMYFAAWSVSFYPQVFLNYRLKEVKGYSFNFGVLNWVGFLAYSLYNIWGYLDPGIMPGSVQIQDITFAFHAFVLMTVTMIQCAYYDDLWRRTDKWVYISVGCFFVFGTVCAAVQFSGKMAEHKDWNGCLALGYIKVLITLMKYLPQVYRNWRRKSTVGWSILNILLDFTGGSLSVLQIFIDGANTGNWNVFGNGGTFNIAKFLLGFVSMFFDVIFMIQHYILYRGNEPYFEKESNSNYSLFEIE